MNEALELFSRLLAMVSYFEGGDTAFSAEKVFSPRAILAAGRGAEQQECIVQAEEGDEKAQRLTPLEQAALLLRPLDGRLPKWYRPMENGNMSWVTAEGEEGERVIPEEDAPAEQWKALPPAVVAASEVNAEALSRLFLRDARRYDE